MNDPEIYAGLAEIFRDVFGREDIVLTPELTAHDVEGWDSFKQIEIVLAAQEHFAVRFGTRDIDSLANIADLVAVIARAKAA